MIDITCAVILISLGAFFFYSMGKDIGYWEGYQEGSESGYREAQLWADHEDEGNQ